MHKLRDFTDFYNFEIQYNYQHHSSVKVKSKLFKYVIEYILMRNYHEFEFQTFKDYSQMLQTDLILESEEKLNSKCFTDKGKQQLDDIIYYSSKGWKVAKHLREIEGTLEELKNEK